MAEWLVIRAVAPEIIWARYAQAFGVEELKATYGAHWPPAKSRGSEEVYCWRDRLESPRPFDPTDHPAAWLSLSLDQFDPTAAWMSRGVWPNQHGQGLGRLMREWAEQWCRQKGATSLNVWIHAVNTQHLANCLQDPYWTMDAVLFNPPTFGFCHQIDAAQAQDPRPES